MIYYLKIYNLRFIYYLAIYLSPRPPLPNRGGVGGEASFLLHHYFLAILDVQTLLSLVDAATAEVKHSTSLMVNGQW